VASGADSTVTLKLSVIDPPKGIHHSLQDKTSSPVQIHVSNGMTIAFEIPIRLEQGKTGWRFLGDFVRTEGKTRRFVYVATAGQAGQTGTPISRRAKVDLPEPTPAMIKAALSGGLVLEASYSGTDAKGEPTCATVKVDWKIVKR
jgi:Family of unknown function (DUF5990)